MVAEACKRRKRGFCYHGRKTAGHRGTTMRQRVLIVEDDALARKGMGDLLSLWGYEVSTAGDGAEALERVAEELPAVVVSDLVMPGMDGLALLSALRVDHPEITVIMLTGQGSIETAVQAMKEGAYDYLTKPLDPARLQILLERALDRAESAREVHRLRRELRHRGAFGSLVAGAPAMQEVTRQIEQVAPTDATVLVLGESGTGKELVARTIHDHSARRRAPFVAVNCAAIPETLLESEIFGHERGSFTGATGRRPGCFELADGGTLFLDEIAEMSPATQVKFLRVLQDGRFRRVGGQTEIVVDVRVIAATNKSPAKALQDGALREDLYYRIAVFTAHASPAPRAHRGPERARPRSPRGDRRAPRANRPGRRRGYPRRAPPLCLAGERPRAAQRAGAGGDRLSRGPRRTRPPALAPGARRGDGGAGLRPGGR